MISHVKSAHKSVNFDATISKIVFVYPDKMGKPQKGDHVIGMYYIKCVISCIHRLLIRQDC